MEDTTIRTFKLSEADVKNAIMSYVVAQHNLKSDEIFVALRVEKTPGDCYGQSTEYVTARVEVTLP